MRRPRRVGIPKNWRVHSRPVPTTMQRGHKKRRPTSAQPQATGLRTWYRRLQGRQGATQGRDGTRARDAPGGLPSSLSRSCTALSPSAPNFGSTACVYYVVRRVECAQDRPIVSSPSNGSGTAFEVESARLHGSPRTPTPVRNYAWHALSACRGAEPLPAFLRALGRRCPTSQHLGSHISQQLPEAHLAWWPFCGRFTLPLPAGAQRLSCTAVATASLPVLCAEHLIGCGPATSTPSLACALACPTVYVVGSHGPRVVSSAHASSPCLQRRRRT